MVSKRYNDLIQGISEKDFERQSLLYIIASNSNLYEHRNEIYNFHTYKIKFECLKSAWITCSTRYLILLGFNLYNGYTGYNLDDETYDYLITVYDVFQNLQYQDFTIAINAINIRFNKM